MEISQINNSAHISSLNCSESLKYIYSSIQRFSYIIIIIIICIFYHEVF